MSFKSCLFSAALLGLLPTMSFGADAILDGKTEFTAYLKKHALKKNMTLKKGSGSSTPIEPIRYAKVRTKIYKETFESTTKGMEFKRELVCEKRGDVPVYDVRNGDDTRELKAIQCDSTYNSQPAVLSLFNSVSIDSGEIWENEGDVDYKVTSHYLLASSYLSGAVLPSVGSNSATRDLNQQGTISVVRPAITIQCTDESPDGTPGTCETNYPEFFWAFVEVEDKQ